MSSIKILVIEDDPILQENTTEILKEEGYDVTATALGYEGISYVKEQQFDIVLCDIMLPDIQGFAFLKMISMMNDIVVPPVIFMTALSDRNSFRKGMELGADDFLTKPFTHAELLNSIETQLKKRNLLSMRMRNDNRAEAANKMRLTAEILPHIPTPQSVSGKTTAENAARKLTMEDSIFISSRHKSQFVHLKDIVYIESDKDYSTIWLSASVKFLLRKTLKAWIEMLPAGKFLRINKSVIINIEHIVKMENWSHGSYIVRMKGFDAPHEVSRQYSRELRHSLGAV